jgi:hypothetical protein
MSSKIEGLIKDEDEKRERGRNMRALINVLWIDMKAPPFLASASGNLLA